MIKRRSLLASLAALLGLPAAAQAGRPERPHRELRNPCLDLLPRQLSGPSVTQGSWCPTGLVEVQWSSVPGVVAYEIQTTVERMLPSGARSCTLHYQCVPPQDDNRYVHGPSDTRDADRLTLEVWGVFSDGTRTQRGVVSMVPGRGFSGGLEYGIINASQIQSNSF